MLENSFINIDVIINWLRTHQHYAGLIAFTISAMESVAIIGTIIPGTVMMTGLGGLVGAGVIPFTSTMLWAIAGAVAGDYISFWMGKYFKDRIRNFWPFSKHPEWLEKGEAFFVRHGGKSVFLGRFIGPVRALVPVIAGMLNLSAIRFLTANAASALLWAPAYMLPGILVGVASAALPPALAFRLLFYLIVILFVLWACTWVLAYIYRQFLKLINFGIDAFRNLASTNARCYKIYHFMENPNPYYGEDLIILMLCGLASLLVLMWQIILDPSIGIDHELDYMIFHLFNSLRTATSDHLMAAISVITDEKPITIIWVAILASLLWMRHWRTALYWFGLLVVSLVCGELARLIVHSTYPTGLAIVTNGFSYPSRHVLMTTVVLGFWSILIASGLHPQLRRIPYCCALFLIIASSFTGLYFGAHWFSDTVGALFLGITCTAFTTFLYLRKPIPKININKFILPALLVWFTVGGIYLYNFRLEIVRNFQVIWPKQTISIKDWWQQDNNPIIFYRLDRLGNPIEIMNVECVLGLNSLIVSMQHKGWHLQTRRNLKNMLKLLTGSKAEYSPLLREYYHNRPPILVLSKSYGDNQVLVLKLWDSDVTITPLYQRLWIGTLDYYRLKKNKFFLLNYYTSVNSTAFNLPSASKEFSDCLDASYRWKSINFPKAAIERSKDFDTTHHHLLLIKEKGQESGLTQGNE